jgi:hypothetical protein
MENLSFVQWVWADLQANGFKTEVMEYLNANGVSKDDVVLHMEKYPDATLEATIGTLKTVEAKPAVAEALAQESALVAEVSEEASKLPSEDSATE